MFFFSGVQKKLEGGMVGIVSLLETEESYT